MSPESVFRKVVLRVERSGRLAREAGRRLRVFMRGVKSLEKEGQVQELLSA